MSLVPMPSFVERSSTTASLALPLSGGAVTLIFKASPNQPTIWSRDDPGTTFTLRRAEGMGARIIMRCDPVVLAFEGAAESDALPAGRSPHGSAPSKRHPHEKTNPQND
jgi:hypothetical protein